jgi:hypothetical protein
MQMRIRPATAVLTALVFGLLSLSAAFIFYFMIHHKPQQVRGALQWKTLVSTRIGSSDVRFDGFDEGSIPGQFRIRAVVTDGDGRSTFYQEFPGGWRLVMQSGGVSRVREAGPGVVELRADGMRIINGRDIEKQYYGVIDGRVALIRLESAKGLWVPNNYLAPNHTIGPELVDRSAEEWEEALRTGERTAKLETMLWLGGLHADPQSQAVPNLQHEDLQAARLVDEVRRRPEVLRLLAELAESPDAWIQEAATFARIPRTERIDSR